MMNDSNLLWMHGPYDDAEDEEQGICRPPIYRVTNSRYAIF